MKDILEKLEERRARARALKRSISAASSLRANGSSF